MSDNKTILQKIRMLFSEELPPVPTPAEPVKMMVDATLEDGTAIKLDKLEVGGIVTVNDMPAPDGEHKLSDGKTIKTSGGVIVEVMGNEQAQVEQVAAPAIPEEMKQLPVKMAAQESTIQTLKTENSKLKEAITQLLTFTEQLNEKVEKFGEQSKEKPAERPIEGLTENHKQTLKNRGKI